MPRAVTAARPATRPKGHHISEVGAPQKAGRRCWNACRPAEAGHINRQPSRWHRRAQPRGGRRRERPLDRRDGDADINELEIGRGRDSGRHAGTHGRTTDASCTLTSPLSVRARFARQSGSEVTRLPFAPPRSASSVPCWPNSTTNGPNPAVTSAWRSSANPEQIRTHRPKRSRGRAGRLRRGHHVRPHIPRLPTVRFIDHGSGH